MNDLLRPKDLLKIAHDAEHAEQQKALAHQRALEEEKRAQGEAFMKRQLHPQAKEHGDSAVPRKHAAANCSTSPFPPTIATTQGGASTISNRTGMTLEGFAKRTYDFYIVELQPPGYRLTARILNHPDGIPGDVGLYISW
jgi:hypothetical protein